MESNKENKAKFFISCTIDNIICVIFGFVISCVCAYSLFINNYFDIAINIVIWFVLWVLLTIFIFILLFFIKNYKKQKSSVFSLKKFEIISCLLFIFINLIVLISNYPATGGSDSTEMINQATNMQDNTLSNHHSALYCLLFRLCYLCIDPFFGLQASVFLFMLLQVIFIAVVYLYSYKWSNKYIKNKKFYIFLSCFIILSPVILSYSSRFFKDVLFAYLILILCFILKDLSLNKINTNKVFYLKFFILLLFLCFIRNFGICISLITLIFLFIFNIGSRFKTCLVCISLLVVTTLIMGPVFSYFDIKKSHFVESVSLPLQQICNVVAGDGNISDSQKNDIEKIIPLDEIKAVYKQDCVDPIKFSDKFDGDYLADNKIEFFTLWLSLMPNNITCYFDAWAKETAGYWSPFAAGSIGGNSRLLSDGCPDQFRIQPWVIANFIPFRLLFNNSGSFIWILILFIVFKQLCKKDIEKINIKHYGWCIPLIATLLIMFLFTPKADEFRYVLTIYVALPYLPCFWVCK